MSPHRSADADTQTKKRSHLERRLPRCSELDDSPEETFLIRFYSICLDLELHDAGLLTASLLRENKILNDLSKSFSSSASATPWKMEQSGENEPIKL